MTFAELRQRQKVRDRWFPEWGIGTVVKVLSNTVRIRFGQSVKTYDRAHVQFLERS